MTTFSQLRDALATVVVVPVTPFGEDSTPDLDTYAALSGRLVDSGISVITPNGNTGEFYALTPAEARQITESAMKAGADQVLVEASGTTWPPRPTPPGTRSGPARA